MSEEERIATGGGAALAMTREAKPARTLAVVTEEIRYLDNQAKRLVLGHAIEIGRRLEEAKAMVPYGEWGNYIEKELSYSQSTANNFMRIFDEYGAAQQSLFGPVADSQTLGNLSYTKALKLLAVPREERESFAQEVDAEHISTRELEAAIRERDEAKKALEEAREELNETAEMLDQTLEERNARGVIIREHEESLAAMEKELAELKARPVEVAVQEPDPEVIEERATVIAQEEIQKQAKKAAAEIEAVRKAKAKAEEDALKKLKEAETQRVKLEASLKEAEEKLAAAGTENKAEAEKLRAETEQLKKQLAMSGEAVTIFKLRFTAWQDAHSAMMDALAKVPEEQQTKLAAAVEAQLKAWKTE